MIAAKEFAQRRRDLMAQMVTNSIAIVAAAPEAVRSRDTYYPYKQSTNLSYLCGFPEPEAVLLLMPGRAQGETVLFCREKNALRETWDGFRYGQQGAIEQFGFDDAFPIDDLDEILPGLLEGKSRVYYAIGKQPEFDRQLLGYVQQLGDRQGRGALPPGEFVDLDHTLHEMRLIKTAAELKLMRRAATISAEAHTLAMQRCRPGLYEYQLQATIEHHFADCGATAPAYTTIVGGGNNGCTLHYIDNRAALADGDLVLIDAGCEYADYAADITRTFPVNGRFNRAQSAIYDLVLAANNAAIKAVRVGKPFNIANDVTVEVITAGLVDLGILDGEVNELIERGAHRDFYMHSAGHWLGMDVHDVGDYKIQGQWREFEPGMVLTIEPGIYIPRSAVAVAEQWRGIAVRIEDNIIVKKRGVENITRQVPVERSEIEKLMRARRR